MVEQLTALLGRAPKCQALLLFFHVESAWNERQDMALHLLMRSELAGTIKDSCKYGSVRGQIDAQSLVARLCEPTEEGPYVGRKSRCHMSLVSSASSPISASAKFAWQRNSNLLRVSVHRCKRIFALCGSSRSALLINGPSWMAPNA